MTVNYDPINQLYDHQTYLDKYILDLLITILICGLVLYYVFKHQIKEELHDINTDWDKHKCKPHYMPFAGFMKAAPGDTVYKKTVNNFNDCLSGIIKNSVSISLGPVRKNIGNTFNSFVDVAKLMSEVKFDMAFTEFKINSVFDDITKKMQNVVVELAKNLTITKSVIGQVHGTIITGIYALVASYYTAISGFMMMSDAFFTYIMVTFITTALILMLVPFTFAGGLAMFITGTLAAVPLVALNEFIRAAFGITMAKIPGRPGKKKKKCFSGHTPLNMSDGTTKTMSSLNVGDTLSDGSVVTSTTLSKNDCSFVNINGVVVTTEHPILYDNKWIKSQHHPSAKPTNHNCDYVYCIGTSSKIINAGGCTFSDWDELREMDLYRLSTIVENCTMNNDIHKYFDTGYRKGTPITLSDGSNIEIERVNPGDILYNGNMVTTTVKVKTSDLDYFSYYSGDKHLFDATANLSIDTFGKKVETIKCTPPTISYNLVTSNDDFRISGVEVGDYNQGIEKYFPKSRWG